VSERLRPYLRWLARVLVSALLVAFVLHQVEWRNLARMLLQPHAALWLPLALLLFNLSKLVSAWRLNLFQRQAGIVISASDNLRLYYAGMCLNLFLSGGIGGDGYKIVKLARDLGQPVRVLLATTLADRGSGLLALLLVVGALMPFLDLPQARAAIVATSAGLLLCAVAGCVLLHGRLLGFAPRPALRLVALGIGVQLLQLACVAVLLQYLQVALSHWLSYLVLFLVSSAVAVLPFTVGGFGLRELSFLLGARLLQLDAAPGVILASSFFFLTALSSLPGAFVAPRRAIADLAYRTQLPQHER
jgi:hypothetical protein